ncbi:MAG TPA: hypothetical protein VFS21_39960 [Roseiflexaceae bacterium]|nr:hypothetical protein [Roseiflexaceae bacterium]
MIHIDKLERYWLLVVTGMMGALAATLLASVMIFGFHLPSPAGRFNLRQLDQSAFAEPGLRQSGAGRYELYVVAKIWRFDFGQPPGKAEMRLPAGQK